MLKIATWYNIGMKKYRVVILTLATILLFGAAGYAFYANQKNKAANPEDTTVTENTKGDFETDTQEEPLPTEPSKEVTNVTKELPQFSDITLTVYVNKDASTGPDGETEIPVGALMPYFYMSEGVYTVQKLTGGQWKDLLTNVSYAGHGGLWAFYTDATEDNVEYRVLRIENGQPTAVSKIFTVKRSEITGGSKAYY